MSAPDETADSSSAVLDPGVIDTERVREESAGWRGLAQKDFYTYRIMMNPGMLCNWWTKQVSEHFQKFYEALERGERPKMALMAPPQHGKSKAVNDFTGWVAGKNPNIKQIFASYSEELGARANVELQRAIRDSETYHGIWPETKVGADGWTCNQSLIEFVGKAGSFRNVTIQSGVTGFALDLGIIDDYVKDRAEANSPSTRDKQWDWFTDVFMPRFSAMSGLLIVCTRWHVDDMLGRYIDRVVSNMQVLRYPAIAEEDTDYRARGEALFPEFKPKELLLERKAEMSIGSWEAEYQQNPILVAGGQLPIDKLITVPFFDKSNITASVRYIDKAATMSDDAAYTAMVLMHYMKDKTYVIEDVVRGRWSALQREEMMKTICMTDSQRYSNYTVWIEQEPGSGGKESAEASIRNLAPLRVFADKVTGKKEVRAEPFAAQVQAGNVRLVAGDWVYKFRDECEAWPASKYKDQVDAAAGALAHLVEATSYDTRYEAFQPGYVDR